MNERSTRLVWIFLLYDVVIVTISFLGSIYLKYDSFEPGKYILVLPLIILIWVVQRLAFSSHNNYFREGLVQRILNQILSFMIFVGIVSTLVLVLDLKLYSRMVLFGTILFFFILRSVGFVLIYRYLAHMRAKGRHVKRVLILGAGRIGSQLLEHLNKDVGLGYMVVGFLDDAPEKAMVSEGKILGSISDLDSKIISENVDEIILAIPLVEEGKINKA
ncbi:MAG: hypothetical protein JKX84_08825, partial [Flavobacteriales bacterium]|nr:hypothetical protein [Flavobacteriales bacterium]